jgi:hypothetical protein
LIPSINKLTGKDTKDEQTKQHTESLLGTFLISKMGIESKQDKRTTKIPINFYASRLTNEQQLTYGFLLVLQPIVSAER